MAVFNLAFAFGLLGNIVSFMVFLAPIPTFYQVYKRKSTEGFQSVPYVVALFSAMLWIYYALLKTNVTLLITINSVGIFIETAYIIFFLIYAPKKPRLQTIKLIVAMNVVGMGLIVVLSMFLTKGTKRVALVGWVCLVFSLCVFVAPLGVVRQVIRTKSVEYMPFLLSFALTLSAVMWFFYGLLIHDFVIAIPNVLGFTFGVIQMILYLVYKNAKKVTNEKIPELSMVIEEQKVPAENMKDQQVIDVVKLSALVCAEILPVVAAKLNENGHNTVEANKNVPMPPKQTVVEVAA